MRLLPPEIAESLNKSKCLDFIYESAGKALDQIRENVPRAAGLLTEEAEKCLTDNFYERYELIYAQCLMKEIRTRLERYDPVGLMLGRFDPESVSKSANDLYESCGGNIGTYLHDRFPLLDGYRDHIYQNYVDCFTDFLKAFIDRKDEVSASFLDGKPITRILHLSTGGADIHRNGRCVVGVKTDVGTVYYKPHDCGVDVLYHEIVEKWFSDCTVAAGVIEGEGYAFVSCLKHEKVDSETDIRLFFRNFGILAALFHGLGSNDMHLENIISCGTRPATVDVETILGTAVRADSKDIGSIQREQMDFRDSLMRTCLLPMRIYKGPMMSPLYCASKDAMCLPEYGDKAYTVEGYEDAFKDGFHEGYGRMLEHRDEIVKIIDAHKDATVRCLMRNTRFYAHIRMMLYRPEYLTEETKQTVYDKLCTPYKMSGEEIDRDQTDYEWNCMLKCDIPYYCTTVGGVDLCGEEKEQTVKSGFYMTSVRDSAVRYLDRLSVEEERFEQDLLRISFAHAPTDEPKQKEQEEIGQDTVEGTKLRGEVKAILDGIYDDAVIGTDGNKFWMSTALITDVTPTCGDSAQLADIGIFCADILASGILEGDDKDARELADEMFIKLSDSITKLIEKKNEIRENNALFPIGLYTGLGGVLNSFVHMDKIGIEGARQAAENITEIILDTGMFNYKKTGVAEGVAGLVLALTGAPDSDSARECIRRCADRLLKEELPSSSDLPYGSAGIGAALAGAFNIVKEPGYARFAVEVFGKIKDDYSEKLGGWPDGKAKIKWMADKGPHAAGIYLAASYASEILQGEDGAEVIGEVAKLALKSMRDEKRLYRQDILDQGNAMTVMAFLKAGDRQAAGRILASMIGRKDSKGVFTVTPSGVRSAFDPSFYYGTVGVGAAMIRYYEQ